MGFRKEKARRLPKAIIEKQWHALFDSHCSSNPRRPPCFNPLFLLLVRSQLPPPIGRVSFGPGTLRQPDQHGHASCQKDGEESKGGMREML